MTEGVAKTRETRGIVGRERQDVQEPAGRRPLSPRETTVVGRMCTSRQGVHAGLGATGEAWLVSDRAGVSARDDIEYMTVL